jgi:3D (Asp-Asp-Asp) domain-containing protein
MKTMMKQILENLKAGVILPQASIVELKRHLANNYASLSSGDRDKVLQQYLEKQIELHLNYFDPQLRPYIRRQLFRNISDKSPGEVSGLDILKACLQLNFDIDSFYRELKQWLLSYPFNRVFEAELTGLVALLRQVVKEYPEMTLEDLIETEQLFLDAASQVINENPPDVSWHEKDFGSLVPIDQIYFNGNQWDEKEERAQVFQKRIAFVTLTVASFGLVLLSSISFLMASSNNQAQVDRQVKVAQVVRQSAQPTQTVQMAQTAPVLPVVKPKPGQVGEIVKDYTLDNRIKRNIIANRSKKRIKSVSLNMKRIIPKVAAIIPVKIPVKKQAGPLAQTVIVGYTEAYNGSGKTKIPLVKTFSSKLKLKANAYAMMSNSEGDAFEAAESGNSAITGTPVINKSKTVTVDPKVIPSGSRVYIKHSPEYSNLDGIYTAEASDVGNAANQTKMVLGESASGDTAANPNSTANDQHEVEVYVLDK